MQFDAVHLCLCAMFTIYFRIQNFKMVLNVCFSRFSLSLLVRKMETTEMAWAASLYAHQLLDFSFLTSAFEQIPSETEPKCIPTYDQLSCVAIGLCFVLTD